MTPSQLIFELDKGLKTKDNFHVKIKGFIELEDDFAENDILSSIQLSSQSFLSGIMLMEALDLVNADYAKNIVPGLGDFSTAVTKFEISTVDAIELPSKDPIDVDIDPSLESQKQSKGVLGKIKSLFGK